MNASVFNLSPSIYKTKTYCLCSPFVNRDKIRFEYRVTGCTFVVSFELIMNKHCIRLFWKNKSKRNNRLTIFLGVSGCRVTAKNAEAMKNWKRSSRNINTVVENAISCPGILLEGEIFFLFLFFFFFFRSPARKAELVAWQSD